MYVFSRSTLLVLNVCYLFCSAIKPKNVYISINMFISKIYMLQYPSMRLFYKKEP